jgi:hypothetical protein
MLHIWSPSAVFIGDIVSYFLAYCCYLASYVAMSEPLFTIVSSYLFDCIYFSVAALIERLF